MLDPSTPETTMNEDLPPNPPEITGDAEDPTVPWDHPLPESGGAIGPFKILSILGEGSFGMVYLAEQTAPVRRRVALKVLKPGMDSRQILARFASERQALALLNHPNIAYVLDAGSTPQGRPYFAMEYVKGVSITDHCDRQELSVKERLELFVMVCDGVQHAHQKGVIHRDIKPSNVLVKIEAGKPVPKIIDFGVAKATAQRLTERTLLTEFGQVIGTPAYMSPEQAEMTEQDIDTRSDIYSLGVLLYEMLVGELPFNPQTSRQAGLPEISKIIREVDPPKPSSRLRAPCETSIAVAQRRGTAVRLLTRQLQGDLDWITMKALEKDRTRRYPTAAGLAEDIARHLRGEPVLARSPSVPYLLGKFLRKYRGSAIAATLISLALVVGFAATLVMYQGKSQALIRTRALGLASAAAEVLPKDPMLGLLLALEADKLERRSETLSQVYEAMAVLHERKALLGHQDEVTVAIYSPNGDRILTASRDMTARLWSRHGEQLHVLRGHEGPIVDAQFSPADQDEFILTVSSDRTARLWDREGAQVAVLRGHQGAVTAATFSPGGDVVLTGSTDATARLWNLEGTPFQTFHHPEWVSSVAFSPQGDVILTACGRGGAPSKSSTAHVWSRSGKHLAVLRGHEESIHSAVFSPLGDRILTASRDGTARLWSQEGKELAVCRGHVDGLSAAPCFSQDGRSVLTGSADGTARLWDARTGAQVQVYRGHGGGIGNVQFSPSGDRLLTSSADLTARLFDLTGRELAVVLAGHDSRLYTAVFSPSGDEILTASQDRTVRVWAAEPGDIPSLRGHTSGLFCAAFSPNGDRIATASGDKTVRIWSLDGGRSTVCRGHKGWVTRVTFSPDGKLVLSRSRDLTARLWDLEGRELATLHGRFTEGGFSHDGSRVVTCSADGSVRFWDFKGEQSGSLRLPGHGINSVVFRERVPEVLMALSDGTAQLCDLKGNRLVVFRGHNSSVSSAVFSRSEDRVLTASVDGTARLWNLNGEQLVVLEGHEGVVLRAVFSPDGERILTCSPRCHSTTVGP
jgi:WD40 repeat protein/serine/threonine protein kinase